MDEKTSVSIAALESALTHMQEANKRLSRLLAFALIIIAVIFGGILYFAMNYEIIATTVDVNSKDGPANYNYIGNDGDIDNGAS